MTELGYGLEQIERVLKRSKRYVSDRFTAKRSWTMDEIYTLCQFLNIPAADILEYFPHGGLSKPEGKTA